MAGRAIKKIRHNFRSFSVFRAIIVYAIDVFSAACVFFSSLSSLFVVHTNYMAINAIRMDMSMRKEKH